MFCPTPKPLPKLSSSNSSSSQLSLRPVSDFSGVPILRPSCWPWFWPGICRPKKPVLTGLDSDLSSLCRVSVVSARFRVRIDPARERSLDMEDEGFVSKGWLEEELLLKRGHRDRDACDDV